MKVIECAIMPNGTKIQLEDWTDHDTEIYAYGFQIGAYPTAQRTGKYRWVEGGKMFRLTIAANAHTKYSNDDVKADYEALKSGKKTLEDLSERFWNGEKDEYYLGMPVENLKYVWY